MYANSKKLLNHDRDDFIAHWHDFTTAFPQVKMSHGFADYNANSPTSSFAFVYDFESVPHAYRDALMSGLGTKDFNSDISIFVEMIGQPPPNTVTETFLFSDIMLSMNSAVRGELEIVY